MKEFIEGLAKKMQIDCSKIRKIPYTVGLKLGKILGGLYGAFLRPNPPLVTGFRVKLLGSEYLIDGSKAENELGFEPKWNLEDSVKDIVKWGGFVKPR